MKWTRIEPPKFDTLLLEGKMEVSYENWWDELIIDFCQYLIPQEEVLFETMFPYRYAIAVFEGLIDENTFLFTKVSNDNIPEGYRMYNTDKFYNSIGIELEEIEYEEEFIVEESPEKISKNENYVSLEIPF